MEHIRTKFMGATYELLLIGGVLQFCIDYVAQRGRGKRAPGPETTVFYGLSTICVLGQVMAGYLGCWSFTAEALS